MDIAVSDAKAQLTDLVRRAEAGEEVILTRHGTPVARIAPIAKPRLSEAERRQILNDVIEQARQDVRPGPSLAQIDAEMYDDLGLPK